MTGAAMFPQTSKPHRIEARQGGSIFEHESASSCRAAKKVLAIMLAAVLLPQLSEGLLQPLPALLVNRRAPVLRQLRQHSLMHDGRLLPQELTHVCLRGPSHLLSHRKKSISACATTCSTDIGNPLDPPAHSFSSLGLDPWLVEAADKQDWHTPTDIQCRLIPPLLAGKDVWAEAPTGSGKTAAFVLPLLQRVLEEPLRHRPGGRFASALVLAPTRELALQTAHVMSKCAGGFAGGRVRVCALHGGAAIEPQLLELREGADVLVATPGRLLDVVSSGGVSLARTRVLVLDEADRLLSPGFATELELLLRLLPDEHLRLHGSAVPRGVAGEQLREPQGEAEEEDLGEEAKEAPQMQVVLVSATFPYAARARAKRLLRGRQPLSIAPADSISGNPLASARNKYAARAVADTITQRAIRVDARDRTSLLRHLALTQGWERILCFVSTQYTAEHVAQKLVRRGFKAAALHGGQTQEVRESTLGAFAKSRLQVLVATDVAARGLDVRGLGAVVNYDLPRSTAEYTHRVGRTGRAGDAGEAVSFVTVDDEAHFSLIEKRHNGSKVEREVIAGFEPKDKPSAVAAASAAEVQAQGGSGEGSGGVVGDVVGVVPGVRHSSMGLAHDRMHGGVKGRRKSKKDKLREAAAAAAAADASPSAAAPEEAAAETP